MSQMLGDATLTVSGPTRLVGEAKIHGAKNAVLPIMIASLVSKRVVKLGNVPDISDVDSIANILQTLNVDIERDYERETLTLDASNIEYCDLNQAIVSRTRAVIWLLSPLLTRCNRAVLSYPGGCTLNKGSRKIDIHIKILEAMGAKILVEPTCIRASCDGRLKGVTNFKLSKVSVGATITAIVAACFADGISSFSNCAREPEIVNLCQFLIAMGCHIEGVGTHKLIIRGISHNKLRPVRHSIVPDRIEAGTYIIAAGITQGTLTLEGVSYAFLHRIIPFFKSIGVSVVDLGDNRIKVKGKKLSPVGVQTNPYPYFATDLQPQLVSLLCMAGGVSSVKENVFDNRTSHIYELRKVGAKINYDGNVIDIFGQQDLALLPASDLYAKDLRCGIALLLAAMTAKGTSDNVL